MSSLYHKRHIHFVSLWCDIHIYHRLVKNSVILAILTLDFHLRYTVKRHVTRGELWLLKRQLPEARWKQSGKIEAGWADLETSINRLILNAWHSRRFLHKVLKGGYVLSPQKSMGFTFWVVISVISFLSPELEMQIIINSWILISYSIESYYSNQPVEASPQQDRILICLSWTLIIFSH